MLTWIYEKPLFCVDNREGNCLLLGFGLEYVDDIEIRGEDFFIYLRKSEAVWRVELDKDLSQGFINKDMVDNLIQEINNALMKKEDYDIRDYVLAHKDKDSYFRFFVRQGFTWDDS